MKKENILGVQVCVTDYSELKEALCNEIINRKKSFLVAINPEKILKARKDPELMQLLNNASYQIADGIGVVYASKLRGGEIRSRVTGIDCMTMLCELSNEKGFGIFMYGAKQETLEKAKANLQKKYPNIRITGTINGYIQNNEEVLSAVNASGADIIFVAMGSPKQENWIVNNMDKTCPVLYQGVGGSFDVFSGNVPRAPQWMQKCGLEWLYRLFKDPSRIGRQLKLFSFLFIALFNRK